MNIILSSPIEKYFNVDRLDGMAVAQCFTSNGIVIDEGIERKGHAAIAQWRDEASSAYEYTAEPFSVQEFGDTIIVISKVEGNFPNSPVNLKYAFVLEGENISRLEITL